MKKNKRLNVDDIQYEVEKLEIKGDGILKQMKKSSTVYKADTLTSEKMEKMLKDMWEAIQVDKEFKWETATYPASISDSFRKDDYFDIDFKEEIDNEIIETGIKTQILFGVEGYEVVDGKITRALTIDEINKLKDE
jgi:hypothetical protein